MGIIHCRANMAALGDALPVLLVRQEPTPLIWGWILRGKGLEVQRDQKELHLRMSLEYLVVPVVTAAVAVTAAMAVMVEEEVMVAAADQNPLQDKLLAGPVVVVVMVAAVGTVALVVPVVTAVMVVTVLTF